MKSLEKRYTCFDLRNIHCVLGNFICMICLFLCLTANGQSYQINGTFMNRESDTVRIQVWSDGHEITDYETSQPFYALILGDRKHYTIRTTSGSKEKYCFIITWNLENDNIQVDIDFRNSQSTIIYKEKKNSNNYTFIYYGSGSVRLREVKIYETN